MKLKINQVTQKFKKKIAVDNFSLVIQRGECVGLIGPNGAGKTTLMKLIVDMLNPSSGSILLNGKNITEMKKEIGYLPQYPRFYEWMTARETLYFMGQLSGMSKRELSWSIPKSLVKVGLSEEADSKVATFSGGMKQRLGIAQTLLHQPSFIVMDEPVSALDPIGRREVLNILKKIKQETTILLSSHILSDVEEICERFVMIKKGKKIEDRTMKELLNKYSENKIRMSIADDGKDWIEKINNLDYVKSLEVTGNHLIIEVQSIELNKNMLLEHALRHHVNILKFEIAHDTLEDIFLKMVVES